MKILFVCEHGAAKSVIAAAYLNKIAKEKGLALQAVAFGTMPDEALAPAAIEGLEKDGITPAESKPQKLTLEEITSARMVVSFCELSSEEYKNPSNVRYWQGVPPVSANYEIARDVIIERLDELMREIK